MKDAERYPNIAALRKYSPRFSEAPEEIRVAAGKEATELREREMRLAWAAIKRKFPNGGATTTLIAETNRRYLTKVRYLTGTEARLRRYPHPLRPI